MKLPEKKTTFAAPKIALVGVLVLSACTSTPPILPQRDFDRPTDVTFVCMGAVPDLAPPDADGGTTGPPILTGRPMRWCHPRGATEPPPDAQHRTFAFLPNSNSGELGVVDADNWKLVDLEPQIGGFNQAPLGILPEQIAASDDGCRVVTVNHGSCDLSLVDPAALLAPTLHASYPDVSSSTGQPVFRQVRPMTASGRVLPVRAGELAFVPVPTDLAGAAQHVCRSNWTGQAIVTFPSCHLVALVDLPTGMIRDSFKVRANGASIALEHTGPEPECKVVDCASPTSSTDAGMSSDAATNALSDAASSASPNDASGANDASAGPVASDASASGDAAGDGVSALGDAASDAGDSGAGGGAAAPSRGPDDADPHPFAIAIKPDPTLPHAYVGLKDSPFVVGFDVDLLNLTLTASGGGDASGANTGLIKLSEGAAGVNRLRLSIDPYLDQSLNQDVARNEGKALAGDFIGNQPRPDYPLTSMKLPDDADVQTRKYLYVLARDASVRVIQVSGAQEIECETNPDPAFIPKTMSNAMACFPLGTPRRSTAVGPGIRLPTPPVDIAVSNVGFGTDHSETSLGGVFAWILTASGSTYVLNINPTWRNTAYFDAADHQCLMPDDGSCQSEPMPAPNTLRDRNVLSYSPALDSSSGPARLDFAPAVNIIGPRLQSVWTHGTDRNAATYSTQPIRTGVYFPADAKPRAQTWAVTWEGSLLGAPRFSGQIVEKDGTVILQDPGMDYCRAGLEDKDLVTLRGCVDNTECGLGKVCAFGGNSSIAAGGLAIGGLCLSESVTVPEKTCGSLLSTVRRYEATKIGSEGALRSDRVRLLPHKDELVLPKDVLCHNPEQVDAGADATNGTPDAAADADAGIDGAADGGSSGAGGGAGSASTGTGRTSTLTPTCVDPADPSTKFSCTKDRQHCYQPCTKPGETLGCREGRTCVRFAGDPKSTVCGDEECYCSDGPDLTQVDLSTCLGELLPYQLNVGGGYLITGSQSGVPVRQLPDAKGLCADIDALDPRRANRISLKDAAWCDPSFDEGYDGRCIPPAPGAAMPPGCANSTVTADPDWESLWSTLTKVPSPNPCLFIGGANDSDLPVLRAETTRHVQALFRNEEIQFMMTNLEQPHSGLLQVRFDVSGGFLPQTVGLPGTVEVGMPSRIVLGPFRSTLATTQASGVQESIDVPFLFVVDQRRLGRAQGSSATRGQLLRIHPRGNVQTLPRTGYQPLYEDLAHSGNLFPIQ